MRRIVTTGVLLIAMLVPVVGLVSAHAPSGAIFTTLIDGTEVNLNQFPSKEDVYLDGGPGPGAPQTAAGLDDGTYVFQVTDPSGKTLLSQDAARCRQFTVSNGVSNGVVDTDCEHATGLDSDHAATTVQLIPYDNTPNPGGVYKVWVTTVEDFLLGCQELGQSDGLNVVDCGFKEGGNAHGFIPAHSKTDNFKVKGGRLIGEIDVLFFRDTNGNGRLDSGEQHSLPNLLAIWTDTHGAENRRYSDPEFEFGTYAHVESPEDGTHYITVPNQAGCTVTSVSGSGAVGVNANTVSVTFPVRYKNLEFLIYVGCS